MKSVYKDHGKTIELKVAWKPTIQVESRKSNSCLWRRINLGTYKILFMKKMKHFETTLIQTICDKNAPSYNSDT